MTHVSGHTAYTKQLRTPYVPGTQGVKRMTVLGRGLVFQPVLVTQTCTYNSYNIITSQNIDITDFPSKKKKKKNIPTPPTPPPPPPRQPPHPPQKKTPPNPHNNNNNKRSHDTSECFDMSLKLSKLHVKK